MTGVASDGPSLIHPPNKLTVQTRRYDDDDEKKTDDSGFAAPPTTPLEQGQEALWVEEPNAATEHVLLLPSHSPIVPERPSTRTSVRRLLEMAIASGENGDTKESLELAKQAARRSLQARFRQQHLSDDKKNDVEDVVLAKKKWQDVHDAILTSIQATDWEGARQSLEELLPEDDISTLGFDNTFDLPSATNKKNAGGDAEDVFSMSSLNEILDGPVDLDNITPLSEINNNDRKGFSAPSPSNNNHHNVANSKPKKLFKKLFGGKKEEKLENVGQSPPSPPPDHAKCKSKKGDVQRFVATVVDEDAESQKAWEDKEKLQRIHSVDSRLEKVLKEAMENDGAESITSLDGVPLHGANAAEVTDKKKKKKKGKKDKAEERSSPSTEAKRPTEVLVRNKPRKFGDMQPTFIPAKRGNAELLTQQSWDNLIEQGAVDPEDLMYDQKKPDPSPRENEPPSQDSDLDPTLAATQSPASSHASGDKYTVQQDEKEEDEDRYAVQDTRMALHNRGVPPPQPEYADEYNYHHYEQQHSQPMRQQPYPNGTFISSDQRYLPNPTEQPAVTARATNKTKQQQPQQQQQQQQTVVRGGPKKRRFRLFRAWSGASSKTSNASSSTPKQLQAAAAQQQPKKKPAATTTNKNARAGKTPRSKSLPPLARKNKSKTLKQQATPLSAPSTHPQSSVASSSATPTATTFEQPMLEPHISHRPVRVEPVVPPVSDEEPSDVKITVTTTEEQHPLLEQIRTQSYRQRRGMDPRTRADEYHSGRGIDP